jgi:hypothetical protein
MLRWFLGMAYGHFGPKPAPHWPQVIAALCFKAKIMSDPKVVFLAKFGKPKYMEALQSEGEIYMQRLRAFKEIEHLQIGDKNEGLSHSFQPDKIQLLVNGEVIEGILGAIKTVDSTAYDPFIFCLYAFTTHHLEKKTRPFIDERCKEFGESVLVFNNKEALFSRIRKAVEALASSSLNGQLVEYVNCDSYHGEMGVFRKYSEYQHQSEFRLVLDNHDKEKFFKLNVGSLKDITQLLPSDEFDKLIEIKT